LARQRAYPAAADHRRDCDGVSFFY
jgi:hypothetical protein